MLREFLGSKVDGTTLPEREEERLGRAGRFVRAKFNAKEGNRVDQVIQIP